MPEPAPSPAMPTPVGDKKVTLTRWRKVIADRLTTSWTEIPHHAQSIDIDVTELSDYITETQNDSSIPRLTYMPFLMKAIQAGINVTPEINAHCYGDHYIIRHDLNIGVAVDTDPENMLSEDEAARVFHREMKELFTLKSMLYSGEGRSLKGYGGSSGRYGQGIDGETARAGEEAAGRRLQALFAEGQVRRVA